MLLAVLDRALMQITGVATGYLVVHWCLLTDDSMRFIDVYEGRDCNVAFISELPCPFGYVIKCVKLPT